VTHDDGMRVRREVLGDDHVDRAVASTTGFNAPFQEFITRYAWGEVWARPGLDRRTRSCITLALLVALRQDHELAMHVRAALRLGVTPDEISEVLLHSAVYAGVPAANAAFSAAQQALQSEGALDGEARGARSEHGALGSDEPARLELPLTGGCGCGAVRFEVAEAPVSASYCHCTRCQRRTGTAASPNARVPPGSFRVVEGEAELRSWAPDDGFEKIFCGRCGSALYSRNPRDPDVIGVRFGAFDRDPGIRPQWRQFVAYAAQWERIPADGLPRYDERPPSTPP
jgi:4-carboxymuconolactone decarboxylase